MQTDLSYVERNNCAIHASCLAIENKSPRRVSSSLRRATWGRIDAATTANDLSISHLWVAVGGSSSCLRSAVPVDYVSALARGNVCDSGPTAYQVAQLGDTVLVMGGTYTSQWRFTKAMTKSGPTGTCSYNYNRPPDLTNCITFKPAAGAAVDFAVPASPPNAMQNQVLICTDFVALEGITFAETDYTEAGSGYKLSNTAVAIGAGDNTCGTSNFPHDIYLHNNTYGGQVAVTGSSYNVWVVGGTAASTSDLPWQFGGSYSTNPYVHDSGIVGVTFNGDNFINHSYGPPHPHHMVCVHDASGSDHVTIAGNRWLNCPVGSFEANGNQTNLLIENNYFSGSLAHNALVLTVNNLNGSQDNMSVRFNSFYRTGMNINNECNNGKDTTICTGSINNNRVYGNIGTGCPSLDFGQGSMSGTGWTTGYNIEAVGKQGICTGDSTSRFRTSFAYVSPGAPAYDLRLQPGAPALGAGDPSSYPARDINGNLRPLRVAPDAGADQRETAELVVGASVGAISLGMSTQEVATTYGLKRPIPATVHPRTVHYRIDGRNIWLRYLRGTVVGIETTSPYYTTLTGLGAGSPASAALSAGFEWNTVCRKAYRKVSGRVATYLTPIGGSRKNQVGAVTIVRRSDAVCPSGRSSR